ncbi:hypothetical protein Hanom_Chr11g00980781 [Helianthus anomalus]
MTNSALVTFSKNCPDISRFKLIISTLKQPDHTTLQPFDDGYGATVESGKSNEVSESIISVTRALTVRVFEGV